MKGRAPLFTFLCALGLSMALAANLKGGGGGGLSPGISELGTSAADPIPMIKTSTWLKCTLDVPVDTSTSPGVGNEEWWKRQYRTMEYIFKACSAKGVQDSFKIVPTEAILAVPRGQPTNFELDPDTTPWAFVPIYDEDLNNLPNRYGGHTWGVLTCHQQWTAVEINVKGCSVVRKNTLDNAKALPGGDNKGDVKKVEAAGAGPDATTPAAPATAPPVSTTGPISPPAAKAEEI